MIIGADAFANVQMANGFWSGVRAWVEVCGPEDCTWVSVDQANCTYTEVSKSECTWTKIEPSNNCGVTRCP